MKRKSFICCLVSMLLIMSTLTSFAGDKCWNSVTGSTDGTTTFMVTITPKTYGKDYIKLEHYVKGYYHYRSLFMNLGWGEHFKSSYGHYLVTVYEGNKLISTTKWEGSKSIKLTFGKAFKYKAAHFATKTYTIKVKPVAPFSNTNKKKFIHWSGKLCNDAWNSQKTPNKWRVYSCSSGIKNIKTI